MYEEKFMREAIRLAVENVKQGTGGPFGAVVVKEGKIIAACANTVTGLYYRRKAGIRNCLSLWYL